MAGRWISRPSGDISWLGGNNARSGKTIGSKGGRSKGTTIAVNRPVSLAYSSSLRQSTATTMNRRVSLEDKDEQYPSEKSPLYQNHLIREMDSVHYSTVPETVIGRDTHLVYTRRASELGDTQLSSLGGTPRWELNHATHLLERDGCNPPSQVEFHRTPPVTNENQSAEDRITSGSSKASGGRSIHQQESPESPPNFGSFTEAVNDSNTPNDDASTVDRGTSQRNGGAEDTSVLQNVTNLPYGTDEQELTIPEWDACNPDNVLRRLKAIPKTELEAIGKREFYKSYMSWSRMTRDQRNKSVSYFRSLPEEMQGLFFNFSCIAALVVVVHLIFFPFLIHRTHCRRSND